MNKTTLHIMNEERVKMNAERTCKIQQATVKNIVKTMETERNCEIGLKLVRVECVCTNSIALR